MAKDGCDHRKLAIFLMSSASEVTWLVCLLSKFYSYAREVMHIDGYGKRIKVCFIVMPICLLISLFYLVIIASTAYCTNDHLICRKNLPLEKKTTSFSVKNM